jgi:PilZ domain
MPLQRRRALRHGFVANAELIDLQSQIRLQEQITDLSLYGCGITAAKPFSAGTRVQVRITYNGSKFVAIGRVAYANSDGDMGIAFVRIDRDDETVLEKWIGELRAQK